jgi:hypothetical protein
MEMELVQHSKITVSVKDIYEAIEKNGFDHLRQEWLAVDWETKKISACVLGQAAINLGIIPKLSGNTDDSNISDTLDNDFAEELDGLGYVDSNRWRYESGLNTPGRTIIYWNDKLIDDKDPGKGYFLPTYEDVVAMAYDVLSPYFDRDITLSTFIEVEIKEEGYDDEYDYYN